MPPNGTPLGGRPGVGTPVGTPAGIPLGSPEGGIHWHVSDTERVEYYATDDKRQEIPWMRVTNLADGTSRVFRTEEFAHASGHEYVQTANATNNLPTAVVMDQGRSRRPGPC